MCIRDSCGLVANPEKGYQLELFLHDESKCRTLLSMIEEHGMGAKLSSRRCSSLLYIKESEKISDMPVSYTHLDVYKRQAYSSATALITATKKAMEEDKDSAMWNIAGMEHF